MNQRLKLTLSLFALLPIIFACSQPMSPLMPLPYRPPPTQLPLDLVADTPPTLIDGKLRSINLAMMRDQAQWIPNSNRLIAFLGNQSFSLLDSKSLAETGRWSIAPYGLVAISAMTPTIAYAGKVDLVAQVVVMDVKTQHVLHKTKLGPQDEIEMLTLSPNGQWLAIILRQSQQRQIVIIDVDSGERRVSQVIPDLPNLLRFSANSTNLLAIERVPTDTHSVRLHSIDLPIGTVTQHDREAPSGWYGLPEASPDNQTILLGYLSCSVPVIDTATSEIKTLGNDCRSKISSRTFSADGSRIVAGNEAGKLTLFDAHQLGALWSTQAYSSTIAQVQFSHDGRYIITVGELQGIKVWSAQSGQLVRDIDPYAHRFDISSGSDQLLTIGSGYLKLWDLTTGELLRARHQSFFQVKYANYSPDGERIAYELDKLLIIRSVQNGNLIAQCAFALPKFMLGFSSAGEHFVLYENYSTLVEYNAQSCKPESSYKIPFSADAQRNTEFAYNIEKKLLALPEPGLALSLYNTKAGQSIRRLTNPAAKDAGSTQNSGELFRHVAISADGQYVAATTDLGQIYAWEIISGHLVAAVKMDDGLWDIAFLSDSTRVLLSFPLNSPANSELGYSALSLMVWDTNSGKLKSMLGVNGSRIKVRSFVIDDTNSRMITESADGNLRLWDLPTTRLLKTQRLDKDVRGEIIALRPDGKQLIIQDADHLQLVDVP